MAMPRPIHMKAEKATGLPFSSDSSSLCVKDSPVGVTEEVGGGGAADVGGGSTRGEGVAVSGSNDTLRIAGPLARRCEASCAAFVVAELNSVRLGSPSSFSLDATESMGSTGGCGGGGSA